MFRVFTHYLNEAAGQSFDPLPLAASPAAVASQPANGPANSDLVSEWLQTVLQHFSMHQLDTISEQALASFLSQNNDGRNDSRDDSRDASGNENSQGCSTYALSRSPLISELKRRIVRLAGAQLDDAFVEMAPDVIDEADVALTFLAVEGQRLEGIRHAGEIYRLVEDFMPIHRLRAYCVAQTLSEQSMAYVITRSSQRFAVWTAFKSHKSQGKGFVPSACIYVIAFLEQFHLYVINYLPTAGKPNLYKLGCLLSLICLLVVTSEQTFERNVGTIGTRIISTLRWRHSNNQ